MKIRRIRNKWLDWFKLRTLFKMKFSYIDVLMALVKLYCLNSVNLTKYVNPHPISQSSEKI